MGSQCTGIWLYPAGPMVVIEHRLPCQNGKVLYIQYTCIKYIQQRKQHHYPNILLQKDKTNQQELKLNCTMFHLHQDILSILICLDILHFKHHVVHTFVSAATDTQCQQNHQKTAFLESSQAT